MRLELHTCDWEQILGSLTAMGFNWIMVNVDAEFQEDKVQQKHTVIIEMLEELEEGFFQLMNTHSRYTLHVHSWNPDDDDDDDGDDNTEEKPKPTGGIDLDQPIDFTDKYKELAKT